MSEKMIQVLKLQHFAIAETAETPVVMERTTNVELSAE